MKHILCVITVLSCITGAAVAQEKDTSAPEKLPTIAEKTKDMQKLDGYIPLYWQSATGKLFMEIGRFNQELLYQVSLPAGLGSNPVGLDRGQLGDSQIASFDRIGRKVLLTAPITATGPSRPNTRNNGRSLIRSRNPCSGASRWTRRRTAACSSMRRRSSCATRTAWPIACAPPSRGSYKLDDSRSALYLRSHEGLPEEHGDRGDADLHDRRGSRPARAADDAEPGVGDAARAPLVRRTAGRELPAAPPRSARAVVRHRVLRLRVAARPADREAVDRAASPPEEGPERGGVGPGQADRLLRGQRRAGTDPERPDRRGVVVETGVRSRRVQQRVRGAGAAGRRRSDGRALQPDQLGAPLDARMVVRRQHHRSAHRRDHQGQRHARLAARAPGHHDRRRPDAVVRRGRRRCVPARADGRGRLHRAARSLDRRDRDGARADPAARGARGRPHARLRAQLRRQHVRPRLGHGLSGAVDRDQGRHAGFVERLRDRHRRLRQVRRALRLQPVSRRRERVGRRSRNPRGRRGQRHAVHHGLRRAPAQRGAPAREPLGQRRRSRSRR